MPGEATLEIIVEVPFATRKAILAGDPWGLPAADGRREVGRRWGEDRGP
jgi:hypothetical protein